MPHPFPHTYKTKLQWVGDREGFVTAGAELAPLLGGPPVEFDGSPKCWSPEALLVSAVELCLMTTFLSMVARKNVPVANYSSHAEGILDKTKDGIAFTSIKIFVTLESSENELARDLLLKAKEYCIISNSLKVQTELVLD